MNHSAGTALTHNKKDDAYPKSLQPKYKARDNRWIQKDEEVPGNNETVFGGMIGIISAHNYFGSSNIFRSKLIAEPKYSG